MYDKNANIEDIEKTIREVWGEDRGYHKVDFEKDRLINALQCFWGNNVTEIRVTEIKKIPFDMFEAIMFFYGKYEVRMEFDRGILDIIIKTKEQEYMPLQYLPLLERSGDYIYTGFDSWDLANLLHNFLVLDKVLKNM